MSSLPGFNPAYPLADLRPAAYNPRRITEDALADLRASLETLGLIKPLIMTTAQTIVAGHQRTRTMQTLGLTHCPAFVLPPVNVTDEIRFNQLHNAADLEQGDEQVCVPPSSVSGFVSVPADAIAAPTFRVRNAAKKMEILRLLTRYGEWGSCVATFSGRVLVSGLYALACKTLSRPCLVYYLPDAQEAAVRRFFGRPYGAFSYDHLPKTTWAQSLAQKMRLRETVTGKAAKSGDAKGKSRTYENVVLPRLTPHMRVLDFGAGQMDYVRRLRGQGVDIRGVEFYLRAGRLLNVPQVQRDIDALCRDLAARGRFDVVVCDSVLNSVDSLQAEADVLTCLAALCRPNGAVIFSGRSADAADFEETQTTKSTTLTRKVNFLDADGFSAMYANGVWRYQKFHRLPDIERLAHRHFGPRFQVFDSEGRQAKAPLRENGWAVLAVNDAPQSPEEYIRGLRREFDLPLPGGKSFGRGDDIVQAWQESEKHHATNATEATEGGQTGALVASVASVAGTGQ